VPSGFNERPFGIQKRSSGSRRLLHDRHDRGDCRQGRGSPSSGASIHFIVSGCSL
jgi:hypothetical protein